MGVLQLRDCSFTKGKVPKDSGKGPGKVEVVQDIQDFRYPETYWQGPSRSLSYKSNDFNLGHRNAMSSLAWGFFGDCRQQQIASRLASSTLLMNKMIDGRMVMMLVMVRMTKLAIMVVSWCC